MKIRKTKAYFSSFFLSHLTSIQRNLSGLALVMLLNGGFPAFAQQTSAKPPPGRTSEPGRGFVSEPRFITKVVDLFDRRTPSTGEAKDGFYLELGNMITGAGWLSAGPGYRQHVLNRRAIVTASGAVSLRLYTMAQATIEFPHVTSDRIKLGAQTLFSDALQVNYFGLGNDSSKANRSGYQLRTNDATSYATLGTPALSLQARIGWLQPVSISSMAGRHTPYPNTVDIFSEAEAPGLGSQPPFLHGDVSISRDTRNYIGHPTSGGVYQATWSGYSDRGAGGNSFTRYEGEALQYIPVRSDGNWIVALRGWVALSHVGAGNVVPFYLMPNVGGRTARGYRDFRFHDRNMQAFSAESRWALFSHVDTALFVDLGSVAPTARQLTPSDLKPSYGAGIRLHNFRITIGRFDAGHSADGWHFTFKMNDPFRRTTFSNGRTPAAPFVP
jgi:Omp85 superfamily domain